MDDKKVILLGEFCTIKITAMDLTRKENEVLDKILEGKSNQEISNELFVSINTTKTHVARILKKKDVKNRIELITKYLKNEKKSL